MESRIQKAADLLHKVELLLLEPNPDIPAIRSHINVAIVSLERISLLDLDLELEKFP